MQLGRLDLQRTLAKYFGLRGAPEVTGEVSVVPVLQVDKDTPWSPFARWEAGLSSGANVGFNSIVGVLNVGTGVLVVDRIVVLIGTVDRLIVSTLNTNQSNATIVQTFVQRVDLENAGSGAGVGQLTEVNLVAINTGPSLASGVQIPQEAGAMSFRHDGPWILPPGGSLQTSGSAVNQYCYLYARGRYYFAS